MKKMIIAGFAGVGKTCLAKKYKNVIDLESSPYKWDYSKLENIDYEKMKGNLNREPNPNFPQNYIDAIKDAEKTYDIICVWLQSEKDFPYYKENNIDYILCYPSKEAFDDYCLKYKSRGNSEEWIKKVYNYYNNIYFELESSDRPKIVLNKGENLEDYLIKTGVNLIKR